MRILVVVIGVLSLVGTVPVSSQAADPPVVDKLVERARYWSNKGNVQKALHAWKQVVQVSPRHPAALEALVRLHATGGDKSQARSFAQRLADVAPDHPALRDVNRPETGPDKGQLTEARELVKRGKIDAAAESYRRAFEGSNPPDELAREYYQTLGGSSQGWKNGRAGLEQLVDKQPDNRRHQLALAQHLTYRESTRREGIRRLQNLSHDPSVRSEAFKSWRKALLWLHANAGDKALFVAYLAVRPGDDQIRDKAVQLAQVKADDSDKAAKRGKATKKNKRRVAKIDRSRQASRASKASSSFAKPRTQSARSSQRRVPAVSKANKRPRRKLAPTRKVGVPSGMSKKSSIKKAFDQLHAGQLDDAEIAFEGLMRWRNTRFGARIGLASVAMQRGQFEKAVSDLKEIQEDYPRRRSDWGKMMEAATFWRDFRAAERTAQKSPEDAEDLFRELADRNQSDSHLAELALGRIALDQGNAQMAENHARSFLRQRPSDINAARLLIDALLAQGRLDEAVERNATLMAVAADAAHDDKKLRAALHRERARTLRLARKFAEADEALVKAERVMPRLPANQIERVYLLKEQNQLHRAEALVDRVLSRHNIPDAHLARAVVLMAQGDDMEASKALSNIPADQLSMGAQRLRHQLNVNSRIAEILMSHRTGNHEGAANALQDLEHEVRNEPVTLASVAKAWAKVGVPDRALTAIKRSLARADADDVDVRLRAAEVLVESSQDGEARKLLKQLEAVQGTMSVSQGDMYAGLERAVAIRRADRFREDGNYRSSFDTLLPLLRKSPRQPDLISCLARLLDTSGERDAAIRTYEKLLGSNPDDVKARESLIRLAIAEGELDLAETHVKVGFDRAPKDPRVHLSSGRLHRARRNDGDAMAAFQRAKALADPAAPVAQPDVVAAALHHFGVESDTPVLGTPTSDIQLEIGREISAVRTENSVRTDLTVEQRNRMGEEGYGQMLEFRFPLKLSIPLFYSGRIGIHAAPVLLDSGAIDFGKSNAWMFGTTAAMSSVFDEAGGRYDVAAQGVELAVSYQYKGWEVAMGSSPLGFEYPTVLGSLSLNEKFGGLGLHASVKRESVRDSVLSYAGVRDALTDKYWGGVVSLGGELALGYDISDITLFAWGRYKWLTGRHVPENRASAGGTGITWRAQESKSMNIKVGLGTMLMAYERNLMHYTLGHGGYFSPQFFARAGVPFDLGGSYRRFHWRLAVTPGFNYFRADQASYYPIDAELSEKVAVASEEQIAEGAPSIAGYHPKLEHFAFAFDGVFELSYRVVDQFLLGVSADIHTGADYEEFRAMLSLQFNFVSSGNDELPFRGFLGRNHGGLASQSWAD